MMCIAFCAWIGIKSTDPNHKIDIKKEALTFIKEEAVLLCMIEALSVRKFSHTAL